MSVSWRIELLGGLRAIQGERVITRFRTQKAGVLLAYLSYYRDRSHPPSALMELLWPDCPLEAARGSLSVALSSLRKLFEAELKPPAWQAGSGAIVADHGSVQLNLSVITTDVAEFEAALQAAAAATESAERSQWLEQ